MNEVLKREKYKDVACVKLTGSITAHIAGDS